MRLFIAINFDEPTVARIMEIQQRLREMGRGSFSHPENLHLTLAFLGEIEPQRVREIQEAMTQLVIPTLRLEFSSVGNFRRDGGDLWWVGLAPNHELTLLQKELTAQLKVRGFVLEDRRFSPHITLARKVILAEYSSSQGNTKDLRTSGNSKKQGAPGNLNKPGTIDGMQLLGEPFVTKADTVSLMLSERINGKLTYTELYKATKK